MKNNRIMFQHSAKNPSVLFLLKKRSTYGGGYSQSLSSGLFNSATMVSNMLLANGIPSKVVEVVDNNSIDREVRHCKPTHVVIEALWVVPSKFEVLQRIYPNIKWIVRIHSEVPFLANEGVAMEWLSDYVKYKNVYISFNSKRTNNEMVEYISNKFGPFLAEKVVYLPNYYDLEGNKNHECHIERHYTGCPCGNPDCALRDEWPDFGLHIGCFGAIRPMKNHLLQAVSAMRVGDLLGKKVYFHINTKRLEGRGEPVLKNLRNLFKGTDHVLVEHGWMERKNFLAVSRRMHLGMQVSFSETFNIVAADMISQDVPMVVSNEIEFVAPIFKARTTSSLSIMLKMLFTLAASKFKLHRLNELLLKLSGLFAKRIWIDFLYCH
jgi:hypothetical protein